MGLVSATTLLALLEWINIVLTSGIVIFSCALLLYLAVYNPHHRVARSFVILLACVIVVYLVDLALSGVRDAEAALPWLRFQWVGIAFAPAAYLAFSNAVLVTTGVHSTWRSTIVRLGYLLSLLVLLGVAFSDLIVRDGEIEHRVPHLLRGPLFPLFAVYFFAAVGWGGANVLWARRRCLTSTSRRRMSYLLAAFAAPAAGVFPYLLVAGWPVSVSEMAFWVLLVLSNIGVGSMLVALSYSVAFFGTLTPDRVVKHRLARFLLRGPLVATLAVIVIIAASQAEGWLGLPGRRLMLFGVVGVIILMQLAIELAKPLIDRLLYRRDQPEIARLQELSNRLLTTTDLRQFLENVLTAICDLLRVETAFVAVVENGAARLEVVCGPLLPGTAENLPPQAWLAQPEDQPPQETQARRHHVFLWDGYWLFPLRTDEQRSILGVVGVTARAAQPELTQEEWAGLEALLNQAAAALEDRQLQQRLFGALERLIPQIEEIQRRRGIVPYVGERALSGFTPGVDAEFREWVRDALDHYWGGPKLLDSPLRSLHVVERATQEHNGNTLHGMQTVLRQAIERLRPEGQRKMTTPEWLLYNILELKFLQGRRVREIAQRLAISESDLYRKQRVAIEAVARALIEMEQEELSGRARDESQ
ncbi:MAG: hypothetical protein N2508_05750 [Anaerolineae bacterium]|nr:hypothetical protein [Anaerolineae bacterium]